MNIKKLNEELDKILNEIVAERYLSVEPEGICLYEGDKCVDKLDFNVPAIELTDEDIRRYARKVFPNITDDIRVVWY